MGSQPNKGGGLVFVVLLATVFVTLKLTDHIDWSWWWVLCPIWLPFAVSIVGLALVGTFWNKD